MVVPVKVDEHDAGTVGHEVEFNEMEPQQYCPLVLIHVVTVSLQRQVTVPEILLQVDGVAQVADGKLA